MRKIAKFNAEAYAILEATPTQSESLLSWYPHHVDAHRFLSPAEQSIGKQDSTPPFENNIGKKTRETQLVGS